MLDLHRPAEDLDDEHGQPTADQLLDATLRLGVAVDQLCNPGLERLDRSRADADDAVRAVEAEAERTAAHELARDRHRESQLLAQIAEAAARRDDVGVRRVETLRRQLVALRCRMQADQARRDEHAAARALATAPLPSLLEQLLDAVGSSLPDVKGGAGSVHRIPIDPKAVELVAEIQRAVHGQPGDTPAAQLRAWAAAIVDENNATVLPDAAAWAERWVVRARDVVAPADIEEVSSEPCPRCGTLWVHTRDDTGEIVRKPALQVRRGRPTPGGHTEGGEIRCVWHSCGARWPQTYYDHLAALMEQKRRERADDEARRHGKAG